MSQAINRLSEYLDGQTKIEGTLGYILIAILVFLGYLWMSSPPTYDVDDIKEEEEKKEEPPRNFTHAQLRHFDGTKDAKTGESKPVYLSLNGTVFDVSGGRSFYGPDGPYELFAGRECGAALAKFSFEEKDLDSIEACADLSIGERTELEGWKEKFQYFRCYPIRGRLISPRQLPDPNRLLTADDLAQCDGVANASIIPDGYAAPSIYIGAGDKVFDVSFGGAEFYGPGGPYHRFAGKDASRALAKMSFEADDLQQTNVDDLTDKQLKVLQDWIQTFEGRKGYPCVGRLGKEQVNTDAQETNATTTTTTTSSKNDPTLEQQPSTAAATTTAAQHE